MNTPLKSTHYVPEQSRATIRCVRSDAAFEIPYNSMPILRQYSLIGFSMANCISGPPSGYAQSPSGARNLCETSLDQLMGPSRQSNPTATPTRGQVYDI